MPDAVRVWQKAIAVSSCEPAARLVKILRCDNEIYDIGILIPPGIRNGGS